MAGLALGLWGSGQLLADLGLPVLARHRAAQAATGARRLGWRIRLCGATPLAPVLQPRLAAALTELRLAGAEPPAETEIEPRGPAQQAIQATIRAALRRGGLWSEFEPVLGRSVGSRSSPAGEISRLAALPGERPLPRLLRAAVALDHRAEAVGVFRGIAVVLPAGAPAALPPAAARPGWRRSRRAPWREARPWVEAAPGLDLWLDLAPTDGLADWLLARRLRDLPDAPRRTPAIAALGPARVVAALRLRPVQADRRGRLYQVGPVADPSLFVAVWDAVLDSNGQPLEHWLSVPPHTATAAEGVAWSFGLDEAAYRPVREI